MQKPPLIAIVGPTASGKSRLGIELAKKYNGYIISADSRQIYRGMNIATGKEPGKMKKWAGLEAYMVEDIPHFMIDIKNPDETFTVADFQDQVYTIIDHIQKSKPDSIPFLVGGTGLYIQAIVDNLDMPRGEPNKGLRAELEGMDEEELFAMLKEKDPETAKVIQKKNKRRLIRALEVVFGTGESFIKQQKKKEAKFEILQIGIKREKEELHTRINARVKQMFLNGIENEIRELTKKYSIELPSMTGIGYPEIYAAMEGEIEIEKAREQIKINSRQYARRQMQWLKRDLRIQWVADPVDAELIVSEFLKKKSGRR